MICTRLSTILILLIICLPEVYAKDFDHPNMFLSQSEINIIKDRIDKEPWKTAYNRVISNADLSLNTTIQSVIFGGRTPPSNNQQDYWSDMPYSSDGVYSSNVDRTDYYAAMKLRDSVRDLGLAYQLTGDRKYADKAIELIHGWVANPKTKMNPKFTNEQSKVELSITMPGMFYGADLIWNYPGFSSSDKSALKLWTKEFIKSAKTWEGQYDNNYELWRLSVVAAGSVITEDSASLQDTFNKWKAEIPKQMDMQGRMIKEYKRTRGLTYSLLGISALINTAEIARHHGEDLYNYKTEDGRGIELALDFTAPYASGEKIWPYQEIRWDLINYGLFELAYSFKQKQPYKDVIMKRGRPMSEGRNIGPVTLTHGSDLTITTYIMTTMIMPTMTAIATTPVKTAMSAKTIMIIILVLLCIIVIMIMIVKNRNHYKESKK